MTTKATKGEFSYLQQKKKQEILKTVLFFGISAAIFFLGYFSTGSKNNMLTVIAVLGCLPASKSAVSMIMNLKMKGCSEEFHEKIIQAVGSDVGCYNLYFTSYDKNFDIAHLLVKGLTIIAFTENSKVEEAVFEEHLKKMLKNDGINGYHVKLYKDLSKYITRMKQMQQTESEKGKEDDVIKTLYAVSL